MDCRTAGDDNVNWTACVNTRGPSGSIKVFRFLDHVTDHPMLVLIVLKMNSYFVNSVLYKEAENCLGIIHAVL